MFFTSFFCYLQKYGSEVFNGWFKSNYINEKPTPAYVMTPERWNSRTPWMALRQCCRLEGFPPVEVFITYIWEGAWRILWVWRTSWDMWVVYFLSLNESPSMMKVSIKRTLLHNIHEHIIKLFYICKNIIIKHKQKYKMVKQ